MTKALIDIFEQTLTLTTISNHNPIEFLQQSTTKLISFSRFFIPLVITAIIASLIQTGPIISAHPLKPDINRINPARGFKQLISTKKLYETLKTLLKMSVIFPIGFYLILKWLPESIQLLSTNKSSYPSLILQPTLSILTTVIIAFTAIALIDWLYTHKQQLKELRMTRQELKDEIKKREGDPTIKIKRKALDKALRKSTGSLAKVPQADAVITNPQHLAVLIKYEELQMSAPKIIGKGAGESAQQIKHRAKQLQIPVIESPRLARKLYRQNIDSEIHHKHFQAVAKIYQQIERNKRKENQ